MKGKKGRTMDPVKPTLNPCCLTPVGLRCEYRENPAGMDEMSPRLSWRLEANDPAARGLRQKAYQVLVASSRDALDQDRGDLWDSTVVGSDQTSRVLYAGVPPSSRMECHWKVRVWDQEDRPSAWSAPARWTMGLLRPEDWTAKWILEDETPPDPEPVAPLFRKTFELPSPPVRATVYVSSLGYHELYLNGQKVGEAVLAPQVSLMDRYVFYTTHDVSRLVQAGANGVGLWLGDGYVSRFFPYSKPQGIVQLEIECCDGSLVTVNSDETWRTRPSHLRRIGRFVWGDYGGERWDGTQELPDWNLPALNDADWKPVCVRTGGTPTRREALETDLPDRMKVETPAATPVLRAQAIPPTVVLQEIEPRAVQKEANQTWLVDMGRVVTGWFTFAGQGTAGQAVTVYYMQSLLADAGKPAGSDPTLIGMVSQDLVDPDAGGCVRFCNKFNYHTFRYVRIQGLTRAPSAAQTKAMILGTDLEPAFSFSCSNDLANRIHQASLNTLMANSIGGYISDCPDRERAAYAFGYSLGYASLLMQHYADGIVFLEKTVRDAVDAQRADGLPATCSPVGPGGGSGLWTNHNGGGYVFIRTPWQIYLNSGDKRAMEMARAAAEKYLLAMPRCFDDKAALVGISQWEFLGDWYAFGIPGDTSGFNPLGKAIQGNCLYILSLDRMSRILDAFGETEQAVRYRAKADEQRRLFHANYYGKDAANYGLDHMSYLAEPLLAQIPPKEEEDAVFRALEHNIRMVAKGHPHSGDGGMHHLMAFLLACNRPDLVYLMVNQTERPSWGAMIMNGDETIWEHWTDVHSKSHVGVGGIGEWFLNGLAGIHCDPARPGFRHAVVRPYFPPDMEWLSASSDSVQGRIAVSWRKQDGVVKLEVSIPPNTTAMLVLPVGRPEDIAESGKPLHQDFTAARDGLTLIELFSGNFVFAWRL